MKAVGSRECQLLRPEIRFHSHQYLVSVQTPVDMFYFFHFADVCVCLGLLFRNKHITKSSSKQADLCR